MKDHPLLFSGPMVRAILDGRKTQTRRVMKPQPDPRETEFRFNADNGCWFGVCPRNPETGGPTRGRDFRSPYGVPGDRLWAKEAWAVRAASTGGSLSDCPGRRLGFCYRASGEQADEDGHVQIHQEVQVDRETQQKYRRLITEPNWRSARFMPKIACRLWLEVLRVWPERVQDISEADALAEGIRRFEYGTQYGTAHISIGYGTSRLALGAMAPTAANAFCRLWDSINAASGHPWANNDWVWAIEFKRINHA